MTNQKIQNDIDLMKKIVRDLKQEKYIKNEWIEKEKREKKEEYQDKGIIEIWSNRSKEIDLEINVLEDEIKVLETELKAEVQR